MNNRRALYIGPALLALLLGAFLVGRRSEPDRPVRARGPAGAVTDHEPVVGDAPRTERPESLPRASKRGGKMRMPNPMEKIRPRITAAAASGPAPFAMRDKHVTAFFAPDGIALALKGSTKPGAAQADRRAWGLHWSMVGARPVEPRPEGELAGRVNSLVGARDQWKVDQKSYERVVYDEVKPGVDLVVESRKHGVKYTLHAEQAADLARIPLRYAGAANLSVVDEGQALEIRTETGTLREDGLRVWQDGPSGRQAVSARYEVTGPQDYAIEVEGFDPSLPLTVDPVIGWSSYLGGASSTAQASDYGITIAVDNAGNAYAAGYTFCIDFPTTGGFDTTANGDVDAFVTKISPTGSLVWSTYLGGVEYEYIFAIDVDKTSQEVYVGGYTFSSDFPTTAGAFDTFLNSTEAFVTKIDSSGSSLVWSTFVGGTSSEYGQALVLDPSGDVYIAGRTYSTNFPIVGGFDASAATTPDGFIARVAADGASLVWSSYLGGNSSDYIQDLVVGPGVGDLYIAGYTYSSDFPVFGGFDSLIGLTPDGYVTKVDKDGTAILWSTFVGGLGNDNIEAIAVDVSGDVYVTGDTTSSDFPITGGVLDPSLAGTDSFVTKISSTGSLVWSTFLGGASTDVGYGIQIGPGNEPIVAGYTLSSDFPTSPGAYDTTVSSYDSYVTQLNSTGSAVVWSSYVGGSSSEYLRDLATDTLGNAYIIGYTYSTNYPLQNEFDSTLGGSIDAFVTKVDISGNTLDWSSYLGGASGPGNDQGYDLAVGASGKVYVIGHTDATDYPVTVGAYDTTFGGSRDIFVSCIDATGAVDWATYLGGNSLEYGYGIAVDGAENVYLTGYTYSFDFPTTVGAFQETATLYPEVFVTKMAPTGASLVWSSLLGGNSSDYGEEIAVDPAGNVYVTGATYSTTFPLQNPVDPTLSVSPDVFATKFAADGSSLIWSTYLGGTDTDEGLSIAADAAGNAYVTGYTYSIDYPVTVGAFDTSVAGADAFVTKINSAGSTLAWSTFLGGSSSEFAEDIAVDASGAVYVTGYTFSSNFPTTPGAFSQIHRGSYDVFITKFVPAGSSLDWSTYVGGTSLDYAREMEIDAAGNVYVTGYTYSFDFPMKGAFSPTHSGFTDVFVTKLDATGSALAWSSYLGGTDADYGEGIGRDSMGNVYVSGYTYSFDFPVPGGFDTTLGGDTDSFVTRIDNSDPDAPTGIGQFKTDTVTALAVGQWTGETDIVVKATLDDSDDDLVKLQVELKAVNVAFDGTTGITESGFIASGGQAVLTVALPVTVPAEYHWRARTVDDAGRTSAWVIFGGNLDAPLPADRDVGRDTADPVVTIVTPTTAPIYSTASSPIALAGTASDSEAGVASVTWVNDRGGSGTAAGTTSWSVGAVALQAGVNVITVTATDNAGNSSVDQLTVTFDTQAPIVTIISPTGAATYTTGSGTLNLGGTATDNFSVSNVTWDNDRGGSGVAGFVAPNWTATITLSPGTNVITVRATDPAGNSGTDTLTVEYDTVPPVVTILSPVPPTFITAAATVDISGTASDNIMVGTVSWSNDRGGSGTASGTTSWSQMGIVLMPGANVITVTAFDSVGNSSATAITVHQDTMDPTVTITLPTSAATYSTGSSTVALGGDSTDDVAVSSITWSNDRGGSGSATLSGPPTSPTWSIASVMLQTGDNVITVTVTDGALKTSTDIITVTLNTSSPSITVVTPMAFPHVTNTTPVTITGTASDDGMVVSMACLNTTTGNPHTVNGVFMTSPVNWDVDVDLQAGTNIIDISAFDGGLTTVETVTVIYDPTAPVTTITVPTSAAAFSTSSNTVALGGTASDNRGVVSVTWSSDRAVIPASGTAMGTTSWSVATINLALGDNVLTVTSTDEAGNTGVDVLTVTYDVTQPDITITGPTAAPQYWSLSQPIALAGTASDNAALSQIVWSNAATGGSGTAAGTTSWSAGGVALNPGTNVITAFAFDQAGNTRTDTITVYYDTANPVVSILTPTSNPIYATSSAAIALGGTASDDTGVASVTWSNAATGGSGTATGTTTWSVPSVTLNPGTNPISITATDGAGQTAVAVLTVTYDPTAPVVTITSPTTAATYSTTTTPVSLGGTASDAEGVTSVTWANTTTGGSGSATGLTNWTADVPLTSGDNVITITAYDAAGNSSSDSLTVTYDPAAPIVTITTPTTAINFTTGINPITLGGTASDDVGVVSVTWSSDQPVVPSSGTATGTDNWTASVPLLAGPNVISITASDNVGRTGTANITIVYDPDAPQVTITSPTTDTTFETTLGLITLEGTAVDNLEVQAVDWSNDTTGANGTAIGTGTWTVNDIPLIEGQNVLTITATDGVGNTGTATLTVTYDMTLPTVTITIPTAAATFSTSTRPLTVGGTASDNLEVASVTWVNDLGGSGSATLTGPIDNPTWSASIYLFPGSNVLTITAQDALGNQATDILTVDFTPETTDPTILIDTPTTAPTTMTAATPIVIGGTADDNVGIVSVTWLNQATGVQGTATLVGAGPTNWSSPVPLTDGSNVIVATATDDAGNTSTDTITVAYNPAPEANPPTITFTAPTGAATWTSTVSPLGIVVSVTDDTGVSKVEWTNDATGGDGILSPAGGADWAAAVALEVGVNIITATATDPAGNTAVDTLIVTFNPAPGDPISPAITIVSHPTGVTIPVSTVNVSVDGTATDNVALATVVWANAATGQSGSANGLSPWLCNVLLTSGLNVITFTAYDTSGNKVSGSVIFSYTAPPPPPVHVAAGHVSCGLVGLDAVGLLGLLWIARRCGRRRRRE